MAARSDSLLSRPTSIRVLPLEQAKHALSRDERVARIQRRRRLTTVTATLENVLWLTGALAVAAVAVAGLTGLR